MIQDPPKLFEQLRDAHIDGVTQTHRGPILTLTPSKTQPWRAVFGASSISLQVSSLWAQSIENTAPFHPISPSASLCYLSNHYTDFAKLSWPNSRKRPRQLEDERDPAILHDTLNAALNQAVGPEGERRKRLLFYAMLRHCDGHTGIELRWSKGWPTLISGRRTLYPGDAVRIPLLRWIRPLRRPNGVRLESWWAIARLEENWTSAHVRLALLREITAAERRIREEIGAGGEEPLFAE